MRTRTTWLVVGAVIAGAWLWLLVAAAPDPGQLHATALTIGGLTNVYTDDGTSLFRNGVAVGGGGGTVGTLINTAATTAGELVKFTDTAKTNTAPATSGDIQTALGQVYQATNAALTALAGNPQLYQATNANLTALAGNANLYQATNSVLTHYQGTDTNAILAAIGGAPLSSPALTGTPTINGQSIETQLTNRVLKAGDTMTGTLTVTGFTNTARTASTFVVAAADKSDSSTATSAELAATLSDETGSGKAVFDTSPTFTTSVTITNASTVTVPFTINHAASATADLINANVGGVSTWKVDKSGSTLIPRGTAGRPAIQFADDADGSGTGIYSALANFMEFNANGGTYFEIGNSLNKFYQNIQLNGDAAAVILFSESTGVLQIGVDSATAAGQTIKAPDGSGTDKVGGSLTLQGGQSTGTGTPGGVIIRTSSINGSSASTANAYHDRARYVPKYVTLTDNVVSNLFTVTLPTTNLVGIVFSCTIECSDGTDFQNQTTVVTVDAAAKGTAITAAISPAAAQTGGALTGASTLSTTFTAVDAGSNVLAVQVQSNTSFASPTFLRAKIVMEAINIMGAGTAITEL